MSQAAKALEVATRIETLVNDALRGLDRTIAVWPAEFRSIIWATVADIAARRRDAADLEKK